MILRTINYLIYNSYQNPHSTILVILNIFLRSVIYLHLQIDSFPELISLDSACDLTLIYPCDGLLLAVRLTSSIEKGFFGVISNRRNLTFAIPKNVIRLLITRVIRIKIPSKRISILQPWWLISLPLCCLYLLIVSQDIGFINSCK